MSSRERVLTALRHEEPDRVPVDFLATPDVWDKLVAHVAPDTSSVGATDFIQPEREALLRHFEIDTRVLSYDMFCRPPDESNVEWWSALDRSTPNRMWRRRNEDGTTLDIWGCHRQRVEHGFGAYEEFASWPLQTATSVDELAAHPWPEPDWWDFSPLPALLAELDEYHVRFRHRLGVRDRLAAARDAGVPDRPRDAIRRFRRTSWGASPTSTSRTRAASWISSATGSTWSISTTTSRRRTR